ncbi:hypothetical protein VOLCADRAFT_103585 [Volvox carteri f. nagariensis]|uniref:Uncharacterized protein n=1 Tax=Volvox carteri f. nagariensis TaxID=3068 RepID=D8TMY7_VOLCA|nr:uncharacterized protein VOLCADRAFT_103585 [Volvox carteri f. nagariensis]EFJ51335.1 hypothetical protein VOLCADRAFT_103585 [Volvox carteri f. nagariensis]|eukprot:XP_002947802.1 hypothetical protein VOLCADRAFT_103585 [Volvox carteri f. nagariensis]
MSSQRVKNILQQVADLTPNELAQLLKGICNSKNKDRLPKAFQSVEVNEAIATSVREYLDCTRRTGGQRKDLKLGWSAVATAVSDSVRALPATLTAGSLYEAALCKAPEQCPAQHPAMSCLDGTCTSCGIRGLEWPEYLYDTLAEIETDGTDGGESGDVDSVVERRGSRFGPAPRALPLTDVGQALPPLSSRGLRSPPGSVGSMTLNGATSRRAWAALRALLALVPNVAPSLEPQHVSSLLYAVAQLAAARSPGEELEAVSSSSAGGGASGLSWVPGGDGAGVQRLVAALLNASLPKLSSFGPQALSNSLYALASLGISPPRSWLRAWLGASAGQLLRADPQHIANMLWAFARLGYDPGDAWIMAALQAAALKAPAFTMQAAMAAAPPSPQPQPLLAAREAMQSAGRRLLQASSRHLHVYSPQQLANTSWAAAVLGLQPPPEWEAQFWLASQAALPAMRTEELVGTAMASAKLRLQPPDRWLAAVLELTSQAMLRQQQHQHTFLPPPPLLAAPGAGDGSSPHSGTQRSPSRIQATGRTLASLLWCVEAWQLEWLAGKGLMDPAALAMALQAMARMGLRPDAIVSGWTARIVTTALAGMAADWHAGAAVDAAVEQAHRARGNGSVGAPAGSERHEGLGPGGGDGGYGMGKQAEQGVGGVNPQCARMLLWSLARLRCWVSDDIAGELALKAAECDMAAAKASPAVGVFPATAVLGTQKDAGGRNKLFRKALFAVTAGPSAAVAVDAATDSTDGMFGKDGVKKAEGTVPGSERSARNVCVAIWALACLSSRPSAVVMRQLERRAALDVAWASDSELLTMWRLSKEAQGALGGPRL